MSNLNSIRLKNICDFVSPGNRVGDIGCDHGYVAIELIKSKKSPHAICSDVGKGPLQRAIEHVDEEGLSDYIECRLSDGLKGINPGEIDTIIIAGMGGMLQIKILREGINVVNAAKELILSPQSDVDAFRQYLSDNKLLISDEKMVFEEGKYYPVIKAVHCDNACIYSPLELRYGPINLKNKDGVLKDYLIKERDMLIKLHATLKERNVNVRSEEIAEELALNEEALKVYEMCRDY